MSNDAYEGFAERYDLFYGEFGKHAPAVVAFYRRLFDENGVHSVLDCACGTGNDLHLFHSLGCEVAGSDVSDAMLARARENLAQAGLELDLRKADYCYLPQHYDGEFDAVVCLSSSILHVPDEGEALRAFESMRGVLRDGGVLVLTQGTTDRQWREKPRFVLAADEPAFTRLFVIDYLDQGARYNIVDVLHGEGGSNLEVWSVEYARMLLRDDHERLLKAADFREVTFYGTYDFEPYDEKSSRRLITVARR
jgi:SAM-dependent methyltransferase